MCKMSVTLLRSWVMLNKNLWLWLHTDFNLVYNYIKEVCELRVALKICGVYIKPGYWCSSNPHRYDQSLSYVKNMREEKMEKNRKKYIWT